MTSYFNSAVGPTHSSNQLVSMDLDMFQQGQDEFEQSISLHGLVNMTTMLSLNEAELEQYARGTVNASAHLRDHRQNNQQPHQLHPQQVQTRQPWQLGLQQRATSASNVCHSDVSISSDSVTPSSSPENFLAVDVGKDDPQTVLRRGTMPPSTPVDMSDEEMIKLEAKRRRNRIAASKCRQRKLDRISELETKADMLNDQIADMQATRRLLHDQVQQLKVEVAMHHFHGCQILPLSLEP
ncbi:hypothetical protein HPB50_010154 [Hyalomma asiaticum]|uniref:Uncharacterized protein n=1 Tax=Hyalomma asiaticum TaxID=266040 RepID=A0ACB7T1V3_HYAAI|nr:hypothetical protein HPB50_010154 [Hyalomma asiaticum]